jgi:hypothetical protein
MFIIGFYLLTTSDEASNLNVDEGSRGGTVIMTSVL